MFKLQNKIASSCTPQLKYRFWHQLKALHLQSYYCMNEYLAQTCHILPVLADMEALHLFNYTMVLTAQESLYVA